MQSRAAQLNPLVAATPDDFALDGEHGADGDAALGQAGAGFGDGGLEEWIA